MIRTAGTLGLQSKGRPQHADEALDDRSVARPSSITLNYAFEQVARETWRLLKRGRNTGLGIPEETITTLNLLKLSEVRITGFSVHSFSKRAEFEIGADWEWWFGRVNGPWLGFRVQAKVLNLNSDRFEHLHYGPRKGSGTQAEQLVRSAFQSDPPRIPLYCMYAHWCKRQCYRGVQLPLGHSFHGCSLLSPAVVHTLQAEQRDHLHDVFPAMWPWHKLVARVPRETEFADNIQALVIDILSEHKRQKAHPAHGVIPVSGSVKLPPARMSAEFYASLTKIKPVRMPPAYVTRVLQQKFSDSAIAQSEADPQLAGAIVIAVT